MKRSPARVLHAELWGTREAKYKQLAEADASTTAWVELSSATPFYLFKQQDITFQEEYNQGWALRDIFPENSVGVVSARDSLTMLFRGEDVLPRVRDFVSLAVEDARSKYKLGADARDWKVEYAQKDLRSQPIVAERVMPILYRPFDTRHTYYTGQSRGFIGQPQQRVMNQMIADRNVGLIAARQT